MIKTWSPYIKHTSPLDNLKFLFMTPPLLQLYALYEFSLKFITAYITNFDQFLLKLTMFPLPPFICASTNIAAIS